LLQPRLPEGADVSVPAVDAVYQTIVSPAPGVAEPVYVVPSKHLVTLTAAGADGIELIVTVTCVLAALSHPVIVVLDAAQAV
jgi:hypothetical protein